METPNNKAGQLTEDIMEAVVRGLGPQGKIPVSNFNQIYSAVYKILTDRLGFK